VCSERMSDIVLKRLIFFYSKAISLSDYYILVLESVIKVLIKPLNWEEIKSIFGTYIELISLIFKSSSKSHDYYTKKQYWK